MTRERSGFMWKAIGKNCYKEVRTEQSTTDTYDCTRNESSERPD
jgi:hypothetical protein